MDEDEYQIAKLKEILELVQRANKIANSIGLRATTTHELITCGLTTALSGLNLVLRGK